MKPMKFAFCLMAVLVFATGCGKDKGGGSSAYSSNIYAPTLSQTGQTNLVNLNNWYASLQEANSYSPRAYTLERKSYALNTSNGSSCVNPIKIFGTVIGCYSVSYGNNSSPGTTLPTTTVTVMGTQRAKADGNAELAKIMNSGYGTLIDIQAQQVQQAQNRFNLAEFYNAYVFQLRFQKANGHIKDIIIDTRYPSEFQPMQDVDSESQTQTSLNRAY